MIVGITIVQDEKYLIEATIRHMLAHGVDHILVIDHRSTDGTSEILASLSRETGQVDIERKEDLLFYQERWTNDLAAKAAARGARWIFPFDADEIFIPLTCPTLAEELATANEGILIAQMWPHASLELRAQSPTQWSKRVFTWTPGSIIDVGAHNVYAHPGPMIGGRIEIRERTYLSAEHFITKTRKWLASRLPEHAPNICVQYWNRRDMDDTQLVLEYTEWARVTGAIHDPVPLRGQRNITKTDHC